MYIHVYPTPNIVLWFTAECNTLLAYECMGNITGFICKAYCIYHYTEQLLNSDDSLRVYTHNTPALFILYNVLILWDTISPAVAPTTVVRTAPGFQSDVREYDASSSSLRPSNPVRDSHRNDPDDTSQLLSNRPPPETITRPHLLRSTESITPLSSFS